MGSKHELKLAGLESLPTNWQIKQLGDLFDILDSQRVPLNSEERARMKGNVPYYGANGIVDHIDKWIFDESLLLLAEDGGYFDEFQTRPISYLVTGKSWVNNHAHVLRIKDGHNLDYFFYATEHRDIRPFINGSTRTKLNQDDLRRVLLPVPPNDEQDGIAKLLGAIHDAIELTRAVIDQTRKLKTALLQDLLTNGLPDRHYSFKSFKGVARIPSSWKVARMESLKSLITSGSRAWSKYLVAKGSFFVRSQNIGLGFIRWDDVVYVDPPQDQEAERAKIQVNDLLISVTGEPGNVAMATEELGNAYVSQHVALVRLADKSLAPWVAIALSSILGQSQFQAKMYGQTRPGLNLDNISELTIPVPDEFERKESIRIIQYIEERIIHASNQLSHLCQTKSALSQSLLTGRVRVPVKGGG